MKLATIKPKLTTDLSVSGLLTGKIEYETKTGSSDLQWTGPKIPPAVWNEVLAFFKDTYNTTKSECQVRLYCNTVTRTWDAWAYPQEIRSGMTTKEIENSDATEQRQRFKESDGWIYLGTVHHHCGCTAFQSGTDRANEQSQDGLHITVGKMDEARHDIHARFYVSGAEFVPDLSLFWDVSDAVRDLIPKDCHDAVARHQMTKPAAVGDTFPKVWADNLIAPPAPAWQSTWQNGVGFHSGNGGAGAAVSDHKGNTTAPVYDNEPEHKRKEKALNLVMEKCKQEGIPGEDVAGTFAALSKNDVIKIIRECAARHRVQITDVVVEWEWSQSLAENFAESLGYGFGD